MDFTESQTEEYARHWCTAIRLARNETLAEAKREGTKDGDTIVTGFKGHPHIKSLARNPLMLSAICLVNYFENGRLPTDRAVLYRLCVEGLLHNWDQRRGIRSDFTFEEKLRVSREIALRMQVDDRAEYELPKVAEIIGAVLLDQQRAVELLQHMRYRTGLLLERRPGIFAFAHLTFQEYLAARAVFEGNQSRVTIEQLIDEHRDPRWQEVIALYCGLAPAPAARCVIEALVHCTEVRASLLGDAYLSSGTELCCDKELRRLVLSAVAVARGSWDDAVDRFPEEEFAPIANSLIGTQQHGSICCAYYWLVVRETRIDFAQLLASLRVLTSEHNLVGIADLNRLLHFRGDDETLASASGLDNLYVSPGPEGYETQAEVAIEALLHRAIEHNDGEPSAGADAAFKSALNVIVTSPKIGTTFVSVLTPGPSRSAWRMSRPLIESLVSRIEKESPKSSMHLAWYAACIKKYEGEPKHPRPTERPNAAPNN